MESFLQLRPLLLRHRQQPLSLCSSSSLPFSPNAVVLPVQWSQELSRKSLSSHRHRAAAIRISPFRCCPNQWISSTTQIGDAGQAAGAASWRRGTGAPPERNTKSVQLRVQLVSGYGYVRKRVDDGTDATLGRADAAVARGASRSEGVECVQEDVVEKKNHDENLLDDDVTILAKYMTRHNCVRVLEVSRTANSVLAGARVLLLDKPGNVHSIYQKYKVLTEAYYDILAALPAVIPEGPIGILGLGAGTAARLIHHFWPEIDMHGWELDPGVIQAARNFFDLEELEWKNEWKNERKNETSAIDEDHRTSTPPRIRRSRDSSGSYGLWKDECDAVRLRLFQGSMEPESRSGGRLRVHVGDALNGPDVSAEGGFAGVIVDLFAEGAVIPALQEVETWRRIRETLRPGGRIMVNCGGSCVEAAEKKGVVRKDGAITMAETIAAIAEAFPGELLVASLRGQGDNSVALTGPPPDLEVWRDTLPECLRRGIENWRPFSSL